MKKVTILIIFSYFLTNCFSQGTWTWKWGSVGSSTLNVVSQGVFSVSNNPSSRYAAVCWQDTNGYFYRYGGDGSSDMWKYSSILNQWARVHGSIGSTLPVFGTIGVPNILNTPGDDAFGHPAWSDSKGNLWMYSVGSSDQIWKYSTTSNMWTFVKGTQSSSALAVYGIQGVAGVAVSPGACNETDCKWIDANDNLWLYNEFNGVLWKYNPVINQWAWIKGVANSTPVYGTLGVFSSTNMPGRFSACPSVGALFTMWQDAKGNLCMIVNRDGSTVDVEIWKYSIVLNQWACMRRDISSFGTNQTNYGVQCVESSTVFPVPRTELRARWVDDCDNLWLYGGIGFCLNGVDKGDLWRYSSSTNNWTWIKGTTVGPVYGTLGVPGNSTQPSPGSGQQHWTNKEGFWLQGGRNLSSSNMHTLWLYSADTVIANFIYSNASSSCETYNFTDTSFTGCNNIKSHYWDFGDPGSGTSNFDTTVNPSHVFSGSGIFQVKLIVENCTWDSDTIIKQISINCKLTVDLDTDTICEGDCIDLIAKVKSGDAPYSFVWNNGITATTKGPIKVCPKNSTSYTVIVTDSKGIKDTTTATIEVVPNPTANFFLKDTLGCPPLNVKFIDSSFSSFGSIKKWKWDFGDGDSSTLKNPSHNFDLDGSYLLSLTVENQFGCKSKITKRLIIKTPFNLFIPNSMTPNGDGINDEFEIKGQCVKSINLLIFNRWGELIYESNDIQNRWDGTYKNELVPIGVYVWRIRVRSESNGVKVLNGHVNVLN